MEDSRLVYLSESRADIRFRVQPAWNCGKCCFCLFLLNFFLYTIYGVSYLTTLAIFTKLLLGKNFCAHLPFEIIKVDTVEYIRVTLLFKSKTIPGPRRTFLFIEFTKV